jgi:hypothetical protein
MIRQRLHERRYIISVCFIGGVALRQRDALRRASLTAIDLFRSVETRIGRSPALTKGAGVCAAFIAFGLARRFARAAVGHADELDTSGLVKLG